VVINRDEKSLKTDKSIVVNQKPVKMEKESVHESGRLKGGLELKETDRQKKHN
jgi:hypothetical protein